MIIASYFSFFFSFTLSKVANTFLSQVTYYGHILFFQVAPIKDHLPKACPNGNSLILDSEVIISCSSCEWFEPRSHSIENRWEVIPQVKMNKTVVDSDWHFNSNQCLIPSTNVLLVQLTLTLHEDDYYTGCPNVRHCR